MSLSEFSQKLESLAENPRSHGCKKLKGGSNEWRIRVGDYIDDAKQFVGVTRIRHRSEVYED